MTRTLAIVMLVVAMTGSVAAGDKPRTDCAFLAVAPANVLVSGAVTNLIVPVVLFAAALSFPHEEAIGRAIHVSFRRESPNAEPDGPLADLRRHAHRPQDRR